MEIFGAIKLSRKKRSAGIGKDHVLLFSRCEMLNFIIISIIFSIAFILGMRWQAMLIKSSLEEKGECIARYGERTKAKVKIIGRIEEIKQLSEV